MDHLLEGLARFRHRKSGTVENLAAVEYIRECFNSSGWKTQLDRFPVPGIMASSIVLHLFFLLGIYWIGGESKPWASSLPVWYGLVLVSFWGEMTLNFHWLRLLIPKHWAANVEARMDEDENNDRMIIILAHNDSPQTGWIYHEKISDRVAVLLGKSPAPFDRFFFLPFAAAVLLGIATLARWLGGFENIYPYLAGISTVVLLLTFVMVFQWGCSAPSVGANDNGSGVLVLLELARRLGQRKPHGVSIRLLSTGAEEVGFVGMQDYIDRYGKELWDKNPLFINIECVGGGELHWGTGEGFLAKTYYPKPGLDIIRSLEQQGKIKELPRCFIISHTDAAALARQGFNVSTLIGLKDNTIPTHYHKSSDTFDQLDREKIKQAVDIIESIIRVGDPPSCTA